MTNETYRDEFISGAEDLNRLAGCEEVAGNMVIGGTDLEGLPGLEHIRTIAGSLTITSNRNLAALGGLERLSVIGRDLRIEFNASLKDLSGLERIVDVGGYCSISNNPSLKNLDGIGGLRSIGEYLSIVGNPSLESLDIPNLSKVGGSLAVSHNSALGDRAGVDRIVDACALKDAIIDIAERSGATLGDGSHGLPAMGLDAGGLSGSIESNPVSNGVTTESSAILKGVGPAGEDRLLKFWKDPDNAMFFHLAVTPSDSEESVEIKVDIMELWQKLTHLLG